MAPYRFCLLTLPFLASFSVACAEDAKPETKAQQQWTSVVQGDWTLPAGEEIPELCIEAVLTEDIYVSAIRPVHPQGTHHTLLAIGDAEDGRCNANVASGLIYAAGVGSDGIQLPPGVAMKLAAGRVLKLGLHLYNTSTEELRGTSGMEVQRLLPEEVKYLSEAVLAGPFDLAIPPGRHLASNDCEITEEQTLYALFPHMHQFGVHFKTTATVSGNPIVLHDGPYDFEEQYQMAIDPRLTLRAGDTIRTECTYQNPTAKTVTFGESSDTEMCFSILFRYPPTGRSFCGSGGGFTGPPCAADGAPGNELGVGKRCSKDGGECVGAGSATACLADYASAEFANFCTKACETDADCGTGAACPAGSAGRRFCLPNTCRLTPATDGGADGG
jgi:hypothetical protein